MRILVLNAGSSSLKTALFADRTQNSGLIDWTYQPGHARILLKSETDASEEIVPLGSRPELLRAHLQAMCQEVPDVVGHRIVHGGTEYSSSVRITAAVKAAIARNGAYAPVHHPAHLEAIAAVEEALGPDIPQVAVFDTAFHAQMPAAAAAYPLPYHFYDEGVRRYGFHGTSHRYVAEQAADLLQRPLNALRLVTCHLGNGCSLAAIAQGHSIDTTMGFTPLAGLMMGTRSGDVDPGVLLYLLRERGYTAASLDQVLNRQSGLLGISGVSNDLRQIQAAIAAGNHRAELAYAMFIHRLRSHIGAMAASLGGLDALVFTAGIGENSAAVRSDACATLGFLGIHLDAEKNQHPSRPRADIATASAPVRVLVIATQEERAIAQECLRVLGSDQPKP
jgi:acetate kinase